MTEVGVDVMRSRIIKLRLCGVHQDRHQTSEAPQGKVEHKGELEAYEQGQSAWGVQRAPATSHHGGDFRGTLKPAGGGAKHQVEEEVGVRVKGGEAEGEKGEMAAYSAGSGVQEVGIHQLEQVLKLSQRCHRLLITEDTKRKCEELIIIHRFWL